MLPPSSVFTETSKTSRHPNLNGESRPWKPTRPATAKKKVGSRQTCHTVLWIDHCQFLSDLVGLHFQDPANGFRLLGAVFCPGEAVSLCQQFGADLIVLDPSLPDCAPIDLVEQLMKISPSSRLLVLAQPSSTELSAEMLASGVHGLIAKSRPLSRILSAMDIVANRGCYFDENVQHLLRPASRNRPELTQREKSVLRLVANGLSTKEIGSKLEISAKTADKFRQRIMRKLDVHDAVQMTRYAISHGLAAL